jgi:hypothetical protein
MLYPATAILSDDAFQDSVTEAEELVLVMDKQESNKE